MRPALFAGSGWCREPGGHSRVSPSTGHCHGHCCSRVVLQVLQREINSPNFSVFSCWRFWFCLIYRFFFFFLKSDHILCLTFKNQCERGGESDNFSEGLCLLSPSVFLCNQLICMARTFVAPVISSDNGWACKADLKTYSLIMCC